MGITIVGPITAAERRTAELVGGTMLFDVNWTDVRAEWVRHDPSLLPGE